MDGPASGLWKMVCIIRPLTAKPAPATMAVSTCGSRELRMILVQISDSLPWPTRMRQMSLTGISTEPMNRLTIIITTITTTRANIKGSVRLIFSF